MPGDEADDYLNLYNPDGSTKRLDRNINLQSVGTAGGVYEAGYAEGDFIPLFALPNTSTDSDSTTSGTYVDAPAAGRARFVDFDALIPTNAQPAVYVALRTSSSSTTLDVRVQNTTEGETYLEETGISQFTNSAFGPTEFTPTRNGPALVTVQIRSGDGTNSVGTFPSAVCLLGSVL